MYWLLLIYLVLKVAKGDVDMTLKSRIVNGIDADIKNYPYQASLEFNGYHRCGAVIIGSKWVVTAAHCTKDINPQRLTIRVGTSHLEDGGQDIKVLKANEHPLYDSKTQDYDISVLELEGNIEAQNASPVTLPSPHAALKVGSYGAVTGWGKISETGSRSDTLMVVEVPIIDIAACRQVFGEAGITTRMFCALSKENKDACQGDSGGPFVVDGTLMGVVSWGHGCAVEGYPGVYTSIPYLRSFITEISGI